MIVLGKNSRRLLSGLCAALLLGVWLFSGLFVAAEAGHDCDGHDCPVCLEMRGCLGNFQLLGSPLPTGAADQPSATILQDDDFRVCVCRTPATTLLSLYVRFDE